MKNYSIKKSCLIIAFAGLVLFAVLNVAAITGKVALIGRILMPFWIGIFMAFILNMLMVPIQKFLERFVLKEQEAGEGCFHCVFVSYFYSDNCSFTGICYP